MEVCFTLKNPVDKTEDYFRSGLKFFENISESRSNLKRQSYSRSNSEFCFTITNPMDKTKDSFHSELECFNNKSGLRSNSKHQSCSRSNFEFCSTDEPDG